MQTCGCDCNGGALLPPHLPPLLCLLCHRAHENIFSVWSWFVVFFFFHYWNSTKRVPTIIPMHGAAELRVPCISSGEGSRARTRTPLNRLFFSARGRFPFPFQILLFLREKLATPPPPPPKKTLCCPTKLCRIIQVPAKPGRSPTPWPACCLLW